MRPWAAAALCSVAWVQLVAIPTVDAQPLAEVARREAARQATIREPGWVYNDSNLVPVPRRPDVEIDDHAAVETSPSSSLAGDGGTGGPEASDSGHPVAAADARTESEWRARAEALRSRIAGLVADRDALEVNLKEVQRLARDAPPDVAATADRHAGRVGALRQRIVRDLKSLDEAWRRLEDEARRHGVPPAWVGSTDSRARD